jgi:uncharacterized membrane protein
MAETLAHRHVRPLEIARRPISSLLLPIPILCFIGAVLTDWAYLGSDGNLTWLFFSTWLIPIGLVFGGFAALFLLIDAIRLRGRWLAFILLASAWVVELFNAFIHMRDGWTAVAGTGFILSIVGALLALAAGWFAGHDRIAYVREVA